MCYKTVVIGGQLCLKSLSPLHVYSLTLDIFPEKRAIIVLIYLFCKTNVPTNHSVWNLEAYIFSVLLIQQANILV